MNFRYWTEKQELGVERIGWGKVYIVLAKPSYNVQRDQRDDHAEFQLFGSNDEERGTDFWSHHEAVSTWALVLLRSTI